MRVRLSRLLTGLGVNIRRGLGSGLSSSLASDSPNGRAGEIVSDVAAQWEVGCVETLRDKERRSRPSLIVKILQLARDGEKIGGS
jgi:hypothetical protein